MVRQHLEPGEERSVALAIHEPVPPQPRQLHQPENIRTRKNISSRGENILFAQEMEVDSPKISDLVLHERHVEHPRAPGLVRFDAAHVVTRGARRQGREQRAQRDLELGPRSRRPSSHRPFGVTLGEI